MSEALRIREAARNVRKPNDSEYRAEMTTTAPPTARSAAHEYRQLAHRARLDVYRKLHGVEALFGAEVAAAIEPALEEYGEMVANAFEMLELDAHIRTRDEASRLRQQIADMASVRNQLNRVEELLAGAADEHRRRQALTSPARRKPDPEWFTSYCPLHNPEPF